MEAGVVVVAAGEGRRFGGPKALLDLEGKSLLERAAEPFAAVPDRVAVLRAEDLPRVRLPGWKLVEGGERRRDSVARGLAALGPSTEVVLVHDAARPLASRDLVARLLRAAERHVAVVPAIAVADTVKRVRGEAVVETLDRSSLVLVQTPQAYRVAPLREALARTDRDATDEAALLEGLGTPVVTVPGERWNLKITEPLDLEIARALLRGKLR